MRKVTFLLICCLLVSLLLLPASASFEGLFDRAGLVSDPDAFVRSATRAGEEYGVKTFVVTDTSSSAWSDEKILSCCDITRKESAVILLVRRVNGTYYYDMYTFGEADRLLSDAAVDAILDDATVYRSLKSGDVATGASRFLTLSYEKIEKEKAARVPRGIAIIVAAFLIVGGVSALLVVLSYRKKLHGDTYPLDRYAKLNLTESQDRFVGSYVTRVRIQSSSSGSRGGGSHGGGGGGGGGHRGGR